MKVASTAPSSSRSLQDGVGRAQQGDAASTANLGAASSAAIAGGQSGDASVSLSGLSSQMRSLAASGTADIDTAHVESIKAAIRNGTLQIDTGKIADGVLETARSLIKPPANN